jgi:hypothetical protein
MSMMARLPRRESAVMLQLLDLVLTWIVVLRSIWLMLK